MEANLIYTNSLFIGKEIETRKTSSIKNGIIIGAIGVSSLLTVPEHIENLAKLEYSLFQNSIQAFNISNDENINSIPVSFLSTENSAIINMNNEQLEVEDLADKVTQAQIDEIKSHFDTKISSLDSNLKLYINESKQSTISELKDFISTENKSIKETKNSKFRFWVGSVIVPIGIALLTIYLTVTFVN